MSPTATATQAATADAPTEKVSEAADVLNRRRSRLRTFLIPFAVIVYVGYRTVSAPWWTVAVTDFRTGQVHSRSLDGFDVAGLAGPRLTASAMTRLDEITTFAGLVNPFGYLAAALVLAVAGNLLRSRLLAVPGPLFLAFLAYGTTGKVPAAIENPATTGAIDGVWLFATGEYQRATLGIVVTIVLLVVHAAQVCMVANAHRHLQVVEAEATGTEPPLTFIQSAIAAVTAGAARILKSATESSASGDPA